MMRYFLFSLLSLLTMNLWAQDKIYLRDNSIVQGKILEKREKSIQVQKVDQSKEWISKEDISVVIYESGYSEVIPTGKGKEEHKLNDWMIGTNILQPLGGLGGIMIERNLTKRYSLRLGQAFYFGRGFGLESQTSVLGNFYLGKGRVKWMNSAGLNLFYWENPYYYGCFPTENLVAYDMFAPYPSEGFTSGFEMGFSLGTGLYVDITRHLAFTTQIQFYVSPYDHYVYRELDLANSGFSFFYKF